jgi:hypothetical protein
MWSRWARPIACLPNSPDVTPSDFWEFVKNIVYAQRPQDVADLKTKFAAAFTQITPEMLNHALEVLASFYKLYRVHSGGHVEVK